MASVYAHSKKDALTNIILCPSHLVEKWKTEIERLYPLSKSVIVDNFDHFRAIEPEINNPRRRKNLFLIISKETAKFGYEERPSVIWSRWRNAYVCPECGQVLYKVEFNGRGRWKQAVNQYLRERDFTKPYSHNRVCINKKNVWSKETKTWEKVDCNAKLWTPLIKEDDTDWFKLGGGQGWVQTRHISNLFNGLTAKEKLDRKDSHFLVALSDAITSAQNDENRIQRAPRKFPVAKFIKRYYKGKIDYLIADELNR